jgi:2-iminoacetate synthase
MIQLEHPQLACVHCTLSSHGVLNSGTAWAERGKVRVGNDFSSLGSSCRAGRPTPGRTTLGCTHVRTLRATPCVAGGAVAGNLAPVHDRPPKREREEARIVAALATSALARELLAAPRDLVAELRALLEAPLDVVRARLAPVAGRIHREFHRGEVRLVAPVYLSDACQNDCAYCGFRRSNPRRRVHLTPAEAVREARTVAATGLRALDLVTGEVPTDRFVDQVARAVEEILADGAIERIHLNLGVLSDRQLARLRAAGAVGYHLYQETYDREVYAAMHRSGPKRDLAARLEAPHRIAAAGFECIGMGVLLGLAELAQELAALAAHAENLTRDFPRLELGFSLPRLCATDAGRGYDAEHPVDDADFERALLWLRTRFPGAQLTLTTREPAALRDHLLGVGPTKLSAGVSTAPGGYGAAAGGREQFRIGDERSVDEVSAAILATGLVPIR